MTSFRLPIRLLRCFLIMLPFRSGSSRATGRVEKEEDGRRLPNMSRWANGPSEYWVESRRPLASLVFIAPLLIVYEAGVLLLGVQNGADAFMRRLLELLGFGQHFLLPILTVCILLGWHYLSRQPWQLSGGIISAMAVESLMLGLCLRVICSCKTHWWR